MPFIETGLPDLLLFEPRVFEDKRGYFYESYNKNTFAEAGIKAEFVQDNQALSSYGVLRGLHFQRAPYAQAKLVRVIEGSVLDVVVDLRQGSPSYGQSYSVELSANNKRQLFVPRGFAHGYVVLSETALFFYKCDNFYHKASEGGIRFDDTQLAIDWKIETDKAIVSEKDLVLPSFEAHEGNFVYENKPTEVQ